MEELIRVYCCELELHLPMNKVLHDFDRANNPGVCTKNIYLSVITALPEGYSAIDKALACHTGSRGSNPEMTKVYSAPILFGTPAMCTLSISHNACHHMLQHEYLSRGR